MSSFLRDSLRGIKKLVQRKYTPFVLICIWLIIPVSAYWTSLSQTQETALQPITLWMNNPHPFIFCSMLTCFCVIRLAREGKDVLLQAKEQWFLLFLIVLLYVLLNPWFLASFPQMPISIALTVALACLSIACFSWGTYLVWPAVFLLSLYSYICKIQKISINEDILIQIFSTSWKDAQNYCSPTYMLLLVGAVVLSVFSWHVIYCVLKRCKKLLLISHGLVMLTCSLFTMFLIAGHIDVNEKYVWPLGNAQKICYDAKKALSSIRKSRSLFARLPHVSDIDAKLDTIKKNEGVIFILHVGESLSSNHLQINGYHRDTTPWLSCQKNIINFQDCISSAITTDRAVLTMLTNGRRDYFATTDSRYLPSSPPIMDFFAATGFRCGAFWDDYYLDNSSHNFFANQVSFFNRRATQAFGHKEDDVMSQLDNVAKFIKDGGNENLFLLINNFGSHAFFTNYDPRSPHFPVEEIPKANFRPFENTKHAEIFLNAYDSTVYYTDLYIQQLLSPLQGRPFVYVYMSDHGEYLGENGYWSRGNAPHCDYHKHEPCKVPFFIFASPEFEKLHPHFEKAIKTLRSNQKLGTAHEHLFHTVLGIMGIKTKYYDSTLDLSSSDVLPYSGPHPERNGEELK